MEKQVQLTQEINNNKNLKKYSPRRIIAVGALIVGAGGVLAACGSNSTTQQETFTMNAKQAGEGIHNCSKGEAIGPINPLGPLEHNSGGVTVMNSYINYLYTDAMGYKNHTVHYDKNQGTIQAVPNPNETFGNDVFKLNFKPSSPSSLPAVNLTTSSSIMDIGNLVSCRENNQLYSTVYDQAILNAIKALHIVN